MSFLINFLQQLASWLSTFLEGLPLYVMGLLLTGLETLINAIPVPSFFSSAAGWVSNIPSFPAYLLQSLQIAPGLVIVLTAYVLRFLIRRLPIIG